MRKTLYPLFQVTLTTAWLALSANSAFAQTSNKTYQDPARITNHNSIVTSSNDADEYVVAGTVSEENDTTKTDIRVTKFDKDGKEVWHQIYDFSDQDRCYHINTTDQGYIITGSVWDGANKASLYLLHIDNAGYIINEKA